MFRTVQSPIAVTSNRKSMDLKYVAPNRPLATVVHVSIESGSIEKAVGALAV